MFRSGDGAGWPPERIQMLYSHHRTAEVLMHRYSFRIFFENDTEDIDLTIILFADNPHERYKEIIIQDYDEGPENWSTSIKEVYEKAKDKIASSAKWFFDWLWDQGRSTPWLPPFGPVFSPSKLYFQLNKPDSWYHCFFYTDDLTFHKAIHERKYKQDDDDDTDDPLVMKVY